MLTWSETFGPVLLTKKAEELRKATGNSEILSPTELAPPQLTTILTKVLVRPVRMFLTESIVFCTCLYLSLIYSIFYLFFEAYPIIFEGLYHLQPGPSGLAFLPSKYKTRQQCPHIGHPRFADIT